VAAERPYPAANARAVLAITAVSNPNSPPAAAIAALRATCGFRLRRFGRIPVFELRMSSFLSAQVALHVEVLGAEPGGSLIGHTPQNLQLRRGWETL
jgi:hypothetical protein